VIWFCPGHVATNQISKTKSTGSFTY
jgi:hypothetical protein